MGEGGFEAQKAESHMVPESCLSQRAVVLRLAWKSISTASVFGVLLCLLVEPGASAAVEEEKAVVLFFASNPASIPRVDLGEQARSIAEWIKQAGGHDRVEFVTKWGVRPRDLIQGINDHSPVIVHFSGVGSENGGVVLESDRGGERLLDADAMRALFSEMGSTIDLVVFTGCMSQTIGEAVAEVVGCAVGTMHTVSDEASTEFASAFYGAISRGRSVSEAFGQGVAYLHLEGLADAEEPALFTGVGVDASVLRPVVLEKKLPRGGEIGEMIRSIRELSYRSGGWFRPVVSGKKLPDELGLIDPRGELSAGIDRLNRESLESQGAPEGDEFVRKYQIAALAVAHGRFGEALSTFHEDDLMLLGSKTDNAVEREASVLELLATACLATRDYSRAEHLLARFVELQPYSLSGHIDLAAAQVEVGSYSKAKVVISKALRMEPVNVEALVLRARLLAAEKDYVGAINAIETALDLEPRNLDVLQWAGKFHMEVGQYQEAVLRFDELERALEKYYQPVQGNTHLLEIRFLPKSKIMKIECLVLQLQEMLADQPGANVRNSLDEIVEQMNLFRTEFDRWKAHESFPEEEFAPFSKKFDRLDKEVDALLAADSSEKAAAAERAKVAASSAAGGHHMEWVCVDDPDAGVYYYFR